EAGQHHPRHGGEEQQAGGPGEHGEEPAGGGAARSAGRERAGRRRDGAAGVEGGGAHDCSLELMLVKIRRSAKVAMMIVAITVTTPIAADWPMSKPRKVRW